VFGVLARFSLRITTRPSPVCAAVCRIQVVKASNLAAGRRGFSSGGVLAGLELVQHGQPLPARVRIRKVRRQGAQHRSRPWALCQSGICRNVDPRTAGGSPGLVRAQRCARHGGQAKENQMLHGRYVRAWKEDLRAGK